MVDYDSFAFADFWRLEGVLLRWVLRGLMLERWLEGSR